jgi:hypothetical protein
MQLTQRINKTLEKIFSQPVDITMWRALRKVLSPIAEVGVVHFFECDLRAGLPKVRPVPGIVAREAFLSDVSLLDGTENASARKADAIERLQRGDRWFVGVDEANGRLTNYRWVATCPTLIPELRCNIVPRAGEVFIYALYTVPEYRRRGIDSFTRQYIYDLLHRTSGVNTVLATIFAGNHASLQASRQFLKEVGKMGYISFRGGRTHLIGGCAPNMPVLEPASPPDSRWLIFGRFARPVIGTALSLSSFM